MSVLRELAGAVVARDAVRVAALTAGKRLEAEEIAAALSIERRRLVAPNEETLRAIALECLEQLRRHGAWCTAELDLETDRGPSDLTLELRLTTGEPGVLTPEIDNLHVL